MTRLTKAKSICSRHRLIPEKIRELIAIIRYPGPLVGDFYLDGYGWFRLGTSGTRRYVTDGTGFMFVDFNSGSIGLDLDNNGTIEQTLPVQFSGTISPYGQHPYASYCVFCP
jgi:hypothetical protein